MPRLAVDDNPRMNLRLRPEQKATLVRAAALRHTDLTEFVLQPALREAKAVIENPPTSNAKLRAAIAAMPKPPRKRR
jgi:uncharacterized protein (DUF1778 family)